MRQVNKRKQKNGVNAGEGKPKRATEMSGLVKHSKVGGKRLLHVLKMEGMLNFPARTNRAKMNARGNEWLEVVRTVHLALRPCIAPGIVML